MQEKRWSRVWRDILPPASAVLDVSKTKAQPFYSSSGPCRLPGEFCAYPEGFQKSWGFVSESSLSSQFPFRTGSLKKAWEPLPQKVVLCLLILDRRMGRWKSFLRSLCSELEEKTWDFSSALLSIFWIKELCKNSTIKTEIADLDDNFKKFHRGKLRTKMHHLEKRQKRNIFWTTHAGMACKRDVSRDCSWHRASFVLTWENRKTKLLQNANSVDKFRNIFGNHSKANTINSDFTKLTSFSSSRTGISS